MKKTRSRRFWVTMMIVLIAFIVLFSPLRNSVRALYDNAHAIAIFLRFDKEFLQETAAGGYYRALLIKHGQEQYDIINNHAGHLGEFWRVVQMFVPGVEALVNGEGDTVEITAEQMNALKEEWQWESAFASGSFRNDVEAEFQRFPLENFVGMTMSEAWEFINQDWPDDLTAASVLPPPPVVTPMPMVTVTPFVPVCITGPSAHCMNPPTLVPGSDGKWAYYVLEGVYFEYPSEWDLMQSADHPMFKFSTAINASEPLNAKAIVISLLAPAVWDDHVRYDRISCMGYLDRPLPLWHQSVDHSGFKGSEIFWNNPGMPDYYLDTVFYNKKHQTMICFTAVLGDAQALRAASPELADENFEAFHHILHSVKIWGETTEEITPIAAATQGPWTSEVISGVYVEYPGEWKVEERRSPEARYFTLPSDTTEGFNTKLTIVGIMQNVNVPADARLDELDCSPDGTPLQQTPTWREAVTLDDFEGSQTLWESTDTSGPLLYLQVVLYNRESKRMVCAITEIYPDLDGQLAGTPELARKNFPDFYRMFESIRLENE